MKTFQLERWGQRMGTVLRIVANPSSAAWAQFLATFMLLLVTGYYARHAARLENRESAKDIRDRRALAVPLLAQCEEVLRSREYLATTLPMPTRDKFGDTPLANAAANLRNLSEELMRSSLLVDARLARDATAVHDVVRSWWPRGGGTINVPAERVAALEGQLLSLFDRCTDIIRGVADPI